MKQLKTKYKRPLQNRLSSYLAKGEAIDIAIAMDKFVKL